MLKRRTAINLICSVILAVILLIAAIAVFSLGGADVDFGDVDITVKTGSAEAVYDGSTIENHWWKITEGNLDPGHSAEVIFKNSLDRAGSCDNSVDIIIRDESGEDVTGKYNIKFDLGTLTVTPRTVTVTSAGAQKVYDGQPLKNKNYEVSGGIVSGQRLSVNITGTITAVGETYNTVSSVKVIDPSDGSDVSDCYRFVIREGTLRVVPAGGASGSAGASISGSLVGGDRDGTGSGAQSSVMFMIYSESGDSVYLRTNSFLNFNGREWSAADPYAKLLDDSHSAYYLASLAFEQSKAESREITVKSLCGLYAIPYYATYGSTAISNDVTCIGDASGEYTVEYYKYDSLPSSVDTRFASYERQYRDYVYNTYLEVDLETRSYMKEIIMSERFSKNDPDVINRVASYIQRSAVYDLDYDSALDEEENIVIAFLDRYKEGVCRHYASAATLLYRTLGIPARYTVGVYASAEAGVWSTVTSDTAHAWVEVYLDGIGWIQVEVTGSAGSGGAGSGAGDGDGSDIGTGIGGSMPTDETSVITVKPVTVSKKFDGLPLRAENRVKGLEKLTLAGYTYKVEVSGSRTELGIGKSIIESLTVYDALGRDVTSSFNFKLENGKIQVYTAILEFASDDVEKVYDREAVAPGVLVSGSLAAGHTYDTVSTASIDVGYSLNTYDVVIYDENGEDVTSHYKINRSYGRLGISHAHITVRAADARKKYDGTPLVCDEFSVVNGELVGGDYVAFYKIVGSQTELGRSDNIVSDLVMLDSDGRDVTGNYEIEFLVGQLTVTVYG